MALAMPLANSPGAGKRSPPHPDQQSGGEQNPQPAALRARRSLSLSAPVSARVPET
jgi:hypothetical protein